jgi:hypothetical protein
VNALLVSLQSKNTNNAKGEVAISGAFTIDSSTPTLGINLNELRICSRMRQLRYYFWIDIDQSGNSLRKI